MKILGDPRDVPPLQMDEYTYDVLVPVRTSQVLVFDCT